jgi:molybdenum cofactor guanylyltransferase
MLSCMKLAVQSRQGFVLAGGKSSRMGVDKVFLDFGGQTLLDRALTVTSAVCGNVTIVGDPSKLASYAGKYGPAVADIFPGCGPLGGIHAALEQSPAQLNLMLAVDMPYVSSGLLEFLFAAAEDRDNHAMITVPRTNRGFQPLCAVYGRQFANVAERALREGKYKIDAVFSEVPVRVIEPGELAAAGFSERAFFNVNTPDDCLGKGPSS